MARRAKATVLVVDDNEAARTLVSATLGSAGYRVKEAHDGVQAVRQLAEGGVDAVLMDVRLARDEDGVALIQELRVDWPDLPMAVFSAMSGDADVRRRAAGLVQGMIQKPVGLKDLTAAVDALLKPRNDD